MKHRIRIASVSDIHLGYRAYSRVHMGRNQRELDVERVWADAVRQIIDCKPDIITIAGDVFHHPRVSMHAIMAFRDGLVRMGADTDAHIVVVQGNHDAGKTADVLSPLELSRGLRNVSVHTEPRRIKIYAGDCPVLISTFPAKPWSKGRIADEHTSCYEVTDNAESADFCMEVMHGAFQAGGTTKLASWYSEGAIKIDNSSADLIALGDYHDHHILCAGPGGPFAYYSGSLEAVSGNKWIDFDRGFLVVDCIQYASSDNWFFEDTFHQVCHREIVNLTIRGTRSAKKVNDALGELAQKNVSKGKLCRLVAHDFPASEIKHIDTRLVREVKRHAQHFQLELRPPKYKPLDSVWGHNRGDADLESRLKRVMSEESADSQELALLALAEAKEGESCA